MVRVGVRMRGRDGRIRLAVGHGGECASSAGARVSPRQSAGSGTDHAATLPGDFIAIDVRGALDQLGLITGETVTEDIIHRIFRDFCVGK